MTTTNPYVNNVDNNISAEQNLIEDLTVETIKFFGHTFVYIPRTLVNEDEIFGEDTISKFESNQSIEMYIENVDGFEGEGDILSKFGLEIRDSATLVLAKRRFEQTFRGNPDRPQEGDLIYFPLTKGLFEITFTEHENPFYQAGKLYSFRMDVELFEFSHEDFETGVPEIDEIADRLENPDDADLNDEFADNETFETEGDDIKDFTEDDPFGDLL